MHSRIAEAVALKFSPVALIWSEEKPEGATQFQKGKWGCTMWLAAGAAKGKTGVCDSETYGCIGGGVGMGFEEDYESFPGGEDCFCHFLSSGNAQWEKGRQVAEQVKPFMPEEMHGEFLHGERYMKSPEQVQRFLHAMPMTRIPAKYVLFKPLEEVDPAREMPQAIIFFVDPDQLSALTVLANYGRGDNENVFIPYAAGCQTVGIYPFEEARSERPRAVVGMTDLSARLNLRRQLGASLMSFAAPWALFQEMEANVEGSFLQRPTWQALLKEKEGGPESICKQRD